MGEVFAYLRAHPRRRFTIRDVALAIDIKPSRAKATLERLVRDKRASFEADHHGGTFRYRKPDAPHHFRLERIWPRPNLLR